MFSAPTVVRKLVLKRQPFDRMFGGKLLSVDIFFFIPTVMSSHLSLGR